MIRKLTAADIPTVADIEASVQAFPWTLAQFNDSHRDGHHGWVVELNGEVIGFAVSMQIFDEASLLTIGIRPDHQRAGWGRKLIDQVIELATENGAAVLFLEVRKSNQSARSLYRRMGFVETGVRKGYYRAHEGREDAILMALTLDEGGR